MEKKEVFPHGSSEEMLYHYCFNCYYRIFLYSVEAINASFSISCMITNNTTMQLSAKLSFLIYLQIYECCSSEIVSGVPGVIEF